MVDPDSTVAQLTTLVANLTTQVATLSITISNTQGQTAIFAPSPSQCNREMLIDFNSREGRFLYERRTTPLELKFDLKASSILKFIQDVKDHCIEMAYSGGSNQIHMQTPSPLISSSNMVRLIW